MTLNYEDLKNEMNVGEPIVTPTPVVVPPVDPTPIITEPPVVIETPTVDPVDPLAPIDPTPTPDPVKPPVKADENPAQARAFAEMRVKNAKYEKALAKAAESEGLSIEAYLQKIEDAALTTRATAMQTNPEVLRRLDEAEAALAAQSDLRIQNHIQREFGDLQRTFSLNDDELTAFTEQLANRGHNFKDTLVDYSVLYRGLNHDKLLEKERQAWVLRNQKAATHASTPVVTGGAGNPAPTAINSMADLDAALDARMPSKK